MNPTSINSVDREVMAKNGKSFYWASRFLGKKYRDRVTQLYGFCRYLDDLVDEENEVEIAKQNILNARQAILIGSTDQYTLNVGIELLKQCQIPQDVVLDLIAGIKSDTELVRIADESELLHYCYQVAGTVGLMMCNALDVNDPNAKPYAIDLGIAMQLTNICRDIKTDALLNRRYIPSDLIGDIEIGDLIKPNEEQAKIIRRIVASILQLADSYYQSGEKGLFYLPLHARISILIAVRIYHDIGNQLQSVNCEYWHRRIIVSVLRKLVITFSTIITACFNSNLWFRPKQHDVRSQKSLNTNSHLELN